MPLLFVGHGSPMNAIESNEFTKQWQLIARQLPVPQAILCISAHWETKGTFITATPQPKTIHDFGGFPKALFDVQYPANGNPELAKNIAAQSKPMQIQLDHQWGLDHGCWSILKHMFPAAEVPVLQLSIDYQKEASAHYEIGKQLQYLRERGVLIIGSGNLVHNLRLIDWKKMHEPEYGFDWALEARAIINKHILEGNHAALKNYQQLGKSVSLAVPSPDHYLPLLYTLSLKRDHEQVSLFNDKAVMGSISMTSVLIG